MFFPEEMKTSEIMGIGLGQIRTATTRGLKGKDDFLDTISQLGYFKPWRPSDTVAVTKEEMQHWEDDHEIQETSGMSSYIV